MRKSPTGLNIFAQRLFGVCASGGVEIAVKPFKEIPSDSLYGSDENCEAAKALGVEVVSPVMGTPTEKVLLLAEFEFADRGEVLRVRRGLRR